MADPVEQATAQDPQPQTGATDAPVANPPEPTAAPAPPAPSGPWANDLEQRFADPGTRAEVDAFLRETVQPHVTRIEQTSAPARDLWAALEENPDATFEEIARDFYGDDAAKAIAEYVQLVEQGETQAQQPNPQQPERDPEVQALLDERQERAEEDAFKAEFKRVTADDRYKGIDYDLFVPFVAKAGDFDQAAEDYLKWEARFREPAPAEGSPEPGAEPAPTDASTAPPVVGSGAASGATAPPAQKEYATVNEAIDDFFDEQRAVGAAVKPEGT